MNKIKITNFQLLSLTANCTIGGSIIVISSLMVAIAKQDAWLTAIITPVFGALVMWIYWLLGSRYPGMTLIGIIKKVFGKWIGSLVAAGFVFYCLMDLPRAIWLVGNFVTVQALPETPEYVINGLFVIAVVIAVLYGIETIVRASEFFLYFSSILFLLAMVLVLPNAKIENLQPVLEGGIIPILKSSVFLSSLIIFPVILVMMIYPININNISEARKAILKGNLWGSFIVFLTILMSILVLGTTIPAKAQFPSYILAEEINVSMIFTRLDFLIAGAWILTHFFIPVLWLYAGALGLSELLGLKDHKKIVLPLGLITLVMSGVVYPEQIYRGNWDTSVWAPYSATYGLILPVLLLVVSLIRKRV